MKTIDVYYYYAWYGYIHYHYLMHPLTNTHVNCDSEDEFKTIVLSRLPDYNINFHMINPYNEGSLAPANRPL